MLRRLVAFEVDIDAGPADVRSRSEKASPCYPSQSTCPGYTVVSFPPFYSVIRRHTFGLQVCNC